MAKTVTDVAEAVVEGDGVLALYLKTPGGETSSMRIDVRAQGLILQALLGSTLDPLRATSRHFPVAGLSRFRVDDDIGLSFLLSPQIGVHFVLDRSLAPVLKELIETFDDPTTWRSSARLN